MPKIGNEVATLSIVAALSACGGNDNAFFTPPGSAVGGGGGSVVTGNLSVTLMLTDSSGATTTAIAVDRPGTLRAAVFDEAGAPVSGAVVSFSAALATFNPTAGSALTNSSGEATVTLLAGVTTGADTVTADRKSVV